MAKNLTKNTVTLGASGAKATEECLSLHAPAGPAAPLASVNSESDAEI